MLPSTSLWCISRKVHFITNYESPEGEWTYRFTFSLTLGLDGGGWLTPCPRPLYFGEKRLGTHPKGGWVGSRAGPRWFGKIRPKRDSISGPFSRNESLNQVRYPCPLIFYLLITSRFNLKAVFNFNRLKAYHPEFHRSNEKAKIFKLSIKHFFYISLFLSVFGTNNVS